MRLLSYPEEVIQAKLSGKSADPFVLVEIQSNYSSLD